MKSRQAVALPKAALALYNVVQVCINLFVAVHLARAVRGRVWGVGQPDSSDVRMGVYLHYMCKYLDMADTAIIVLRKKSDQLSFLRRPPESEPGFCPPARARPRPLALLRLRLPPPRP